METPNIKPTQEPANITIGEQEFQKVGNMNSEPTDTKHAPKNYDLYQDTESGALMGKIEESRREGWEIEKKIEDLDIDLTTIKPKDLINFLIDHNNEIKIYGKYTFYSMRKTGLHGESIDYIKKYESPSQKLKIILGENSFNDEKFGLLTTEKDSEKIRLLVAPKDLYFWRIEKNKFSFSSKSSLWESENYQYEFSFYEIPEGLKELMEKKEVGD